MFCGKNVYHLCYSLFVMDTNGAFKHKSMGVGNKNTMKPKYLKITFGCILHKEILTRKMDQNQNTSTPRLSSRGLHSAGILCPGGLVLSYQAQTNLSGTERWLWFRHKRVT